MYSNLAMYSDTLARYLATHSYDIKVYDMIQLSYS